MIDNAVDQGGEGVLVAEHARLDGVEDLYEFVVQVLEVSVLIAQSKGQQLTNFS